MWVDFPYMEHLDIWDWFLGVQSALSMSEISTWLGADVRYWILPEDHGSWSLHLRCLQRGSCGNYDVPGLRIDGRGFEAVLENAFFPNTVAFTRKTHMICIAFWKPSTIRVECKSWVSKLYLFLFPMRESSVCSWTWCKLRQKEKLSHCLQGSGMNVMPLVQASCSEHVNLPSLLEAYALGPRSFKGFGVCGCCIFFVQRLCCRWPWQPTPLTTATQRLAANLTSKPSEFRDCPEISAVPSATARAAAQVMCQRVTAPLLSVLSEPPPVTSTALWFASLTLIAVARWRKMFGESDAN